MFKNRCQDYDSGCQKKYTNRNINSNVIQRIRVIPAENNNPQKSIYDSSELERIYEICKNM